MCFYSQIPYARPIAAVIFGLAAITDWIDGWVARKYGQTSRFGEFLDPVADKLMVSIVLVMLVQADSGWFEDIIAMIIIGREITISALREWMATIGERANVKVTMAGKVKTALQMFGIAFMVYQNDFLGYSGLHPGLRIAGAGRGHDNLVDDHLPAGGLAVSSWPISRSRPKKPDNALTEASKWLQSRPFPGIARRLTLAPG